MTNAPFISQLLAFARSHDWGRDAYYQNGRISGLVHAYTVRRADGAVDYFEDAASVPATIRALRDFGGY